MATDDLAREVLVNGRGEITLPLVGTVQVTGLSPQAIEKQLVQSYRDGKFLINPQITVSVKEYRYQRVMVTGAVTNPGSYEMIGPRTLLEMLGKAGGLSDKPEDEGGRRGLCHSTTECFCSHEGCSVTTLFLPALKPWWLTYAAY